MIVVMDGGHNSVMFIMFIIFIMFRSKQEFGLSASQNP